LQNSGERDTPSSTEDACGLTYPPARRQADVATHSCAHFSDLEAFFMTSVAVLLVCRTDYMAIVSWMPSRKPWAFVYYPASSAAGTRPVTLPSSRPDVCSPDATSHEQGSYEPELNCRVTPRCKSGRVASSSRYSFITCPHHMYSLLYPCSDNSCNELVSLLLTIDHSWNCLSTT
jgi:hypothetical protein